MTLPSQAHVAPNGTVAPFVVMRNHTPERKSPHPTSRKSIKIVALAAGSVSYRGTLGGMFAFPHRTSPLRLALIAEPRVATTRRRERVLTGIVFKRPFSN